MDVKARSIISFLLLFLFVVISFVFLNPKDDPITQLNRITEYQGNQIKTYYEDSYGNLTFSIDAGYAVKVISKTDNGEIEEYFNEEGQAVQDSSGFYGMIRQLNKKGQVDKIVYFGKDKEPIITRMGYAIVRRLFDENNKIIEEFYYDENDSPICTNSYGYGKRFEYDTKGTIVNYSFIDMNGNPMITKLGYADVELEYHIDEQGQKIEYEFYYDQNHEAIACALGYYGVRKVYNTVGDNIIITYLGKNRKPIITTEGYTTIKRTFYSNHHKASEIYYGIDDAPYPNGDGRYGIIWDQNGVLSYLDDNGREHFNLKKLLYRHSWIVILGTLGIILISYITNKKMNIILLMGYIVCILYMTIINRNDNIIVTRFELFRSYKQALFNDQVRSGIFRNIWLFIPLGVILHRLYSHKRILLFCVVLSFLIEVFQYFEGIGYCEVDDVISNSIGGYLGFSIMGVISILVERKKRDEVHSIS